ncbi:MAG: hypothetical protein ACREEM_30270, partial [Blastocatellia bacterium]
MTALGDIAGTDLAMDHPEEGVLIAFHQNRLPVAARESAGLHLKHCRFCAAKFEDVQDFFEPLGAAETDW